MSVVGSGLNWSAQHYYLSHSIGDLKSELRVLRSLAIRRAGADSRQSVTNAKRRFRLEPLHCRGLSLEYGPNNPNPMGGLALGRNRPAVSKRFSNRKAFCLPSLCCLT